MKFAFERDKGLLCLPVFQIWLSNPVTVGIQYLSIWIMRNSKWPQGFHKNDEIAVSWKLELFCCNYHRRTFCNYSCSYNTFSPPLANEIPCMSWLVTTLPLSMLVNLIPTDDTVMLTAQPEFTIPGTSEYCTREKRKFTIYNLEFEKNTVLNRQPTINLNAIKTFSVLTCFLSQQNITFIPSRLPEKKLFINAGAKWQLKILAYHVCRLFHMLHEQHSVSDIRGITS